MRMAYNHGVKIWLYDTEYCLDTCEPFVRYVRLFADKTMQHTLKQRTSKTRSTCPIPKSD